MKTKIILLSALIALFTVTVASNKSDKTVKADKKSTSVEPKASKGLAMEDRDQFN